MKFLVVILLFEEIQYTPMEYMNSLYSTSLCIGLGRCDTIYLPIYFNAASLAQGQGITIPADGLQPSRARIL